MPGIFIAFEGIDGSGKSSAARAVTESLRARGHDVVLTREPGGTDAGQRIRELLLGFEHTLAPETELLLMCADRAEHLAQVIRPSLGAGLVVISDRYAASTRAYQGFGLGLAADVVENALNAATGGLTPDLTLLFDVDPVIGHSRRASDSGNINALDLRDLEFKTRVRNGYLRLASESESWRVLDASVALPELIDRARSIVEQEVAVRQVPR
jgi:dTMP kinase